MPNISGHYQSYISQNFVFKTYAYPKLSRKTLGGRLFGIRKVNQMSKSYFLKLPDFADEYTGQKTGLPSGKGVVNVSVELYVISPMF